MPPATLLAEIGEIIELANKGQWSRAARSCEEMLKADSCNACAHYYYALVMHSTGAAADAERALRRAIYVDRDFALAHYQLGLSRKEARDRRGCVRSFGNVLDILSRLPDAQPVSPCGQIDARSLRELAIEQLSLLGAA